MRNWDFVNIIPDNVQSLTLNNIWTTENRANKLLRTDLLSISWCFTLHAYISLEPEF